MTTTTSFDRGELANEYGHGIADVILGRGERPEAVAAGDVGTLYRFADGVEVIGTSGDPLLDETADGFAAVRASILGTE